jgi:3-deoxy-manno-octulosonate cytidylyltransferase (CMP-KDO synthetase)
MTVAAVIPARYASKRLPGKPLLRGTGKYLVEHVWERVRGAKSIDRIVVATDDERIREAAASFGAEAVLTRPDHPSGTDRVFEAAQGLDPRPSVVLNVQGDEPEVDPADLDALVDSLARDETAGMATLAFPLSEGADDPGVVKVVTDGEGRALYFSRLPIPYHREGSGSWLGHVGVYAFRWEALERFTGLPPSPLEKAEKLEQNRALYWGLPVRVAEARSRPESIDTPQDYERFLARWKKT